MLNPFDKNDNCEFAKFFKGLGYGYSWDFDKREGLYWHELYDGKKPLIQVEMGIPLKRFLKDIITEDDKPWEYFIAGDNKTFVPFRKKLQKYIVDNKIDYESA